jgi:Pilus formation protein N terminal region
MVFRFNQKQRPCLIVVGVLLAAGVVQPAQAQKASNGDIIVLVDQASLVPIERAAAEIVVGNPSIADVSVHNHKMLIVTGKSYGTTNLIVMDPEGKVVASRRLIVQEPRTGLVSVYKGSSRYTLDCAPTCTPPLVIGDTSDHFEKISGQIKTKQAIGQSSAEGSKQE